MTQGIVVGSARSYTTDALHVVRLVGDRQPGTRRPQRQSNLRLWLTYASYSRFQSTTCEQVTFSTGRGD